MNNEFIKTELSKNKAVFKALFNVDAREMHLWKPADDKWCLLEIVCHLYDEEREDFRARLKHILETPDEPLPPIDPQGWVTSRNYIGQNYHESVRKFLEESEESERYLQQLSKPNWENANHHPVFGSMTAKMLLANWLAHDYLHFRQITRLKYQYLQHISGENLTYAGDW